MTLLLLPALRSDDTLGFLAALGVLELCTSTLRLDVRLGWEGIGGGALLESRFASTADLAGALAGVASAMVAQGRVLPCDDQGPVRPPDRAARAGSEVKGKLDPVHLLPTQAIDSFGRARAAERAGDVDSARWLSALVNQLSDAASTGHRALTRFYAPSGQMTLHQVYGDHLNRVHKHPALLDEALTYWVRSPNETGANLDGRALRDATVGSLGKAVNAAAVGATWLALMAVPLFPQVSGRPPLAIGWEVPTRGKPALRWPIWARPLDRAGLSVLLGHPALAEPGPRADVQLRALGLLAVCHSRRKELPQSAGALQPPAVNPVR